MSGDIDRDDRRNRDAQAPAHPLLMFGLGVLMLGVGVAAAIPVAASHQPDAR
jgi:hypothetical protein